MIDEKMIYDTLKDEYDGLKEFNANDNKLKELSKEYADHLDDEFFEGATLGTVCFTIYCDTQERYLNYH